MLSHMCFLLVLIDVTATAAKDDVHAIDAAESEQVPEDSVARKFHTSDEETQESLAGKYL